MEPNRNDQAYCTARTRRHQRAAMEPNCNDHRAASGDAVSRKYASPQCGSGEPRMSRVGCRAARGPGVPPIRVVGYWKAVNCYRFRFLVTCTQGEVSGFPGRLRTVHDNACYRGLSAACAGRPRREVRDTVGPVPGFWRDGYSGPVATPTFHCTVPALAGDVQTQVRGRQVTDLPVGADRGTGRRGARGMG